MIACIHFQPFELWHAVWLNPQLKDKPLVSLENNKIKHSNKVAQQNNITANMSLEGAKAHRDDLRIINTTHATLSTAWDDLLNQFYAFTNQIEAKEQGLVFLDLNKNDAQLIAKSFNARLAFACNKQYAHLLALSLEEKDVYLASEQKQKHTLKNLPLTLLEQIGLSPKTIMRFHWLGLKTLGDLQKWTKNQLSLYLGDEAKLLLPYIKGPYDKYINVFMPQQSLNTSFHFEDTVLEPWQINPVLKHLITTLIDQLGDKAASKVTLTAQVDGLNFSANRLSKEPLNTEDKVYRIAMLTLNDTGISGLGIESLRLELAGIYRPSTQPNLFQKKNPALLAIQKVEKHFPGSLMRFKQINPYLPIPEFEYQTIPLGAGTEVKHEQLSFRRSSSGRKTQQSQQQSRLLHS